MENKIFNMISHQTSKIEYRLYFQINILILAQSLIHLLGFELKRNMQINKQINKQRNKQINNQSNKCDWNIGGNSSFLLVFWILLSTTDLSGNVVVSFNPVSLLPDENKETKIIVCTIKKTLSTKFHNKILFWAKNYHLLNQTIWHVLRNWTGIK